MVRWQYAITLSALLVLQLPAYSKDKHAHTSAASPARKLVNTGIKKSSAHKVEASPIAVQGAHSSKASVSEADDADETPVQVLEPDGNEDPNPPAGALYTDSDETG